MRGWAFGIIDRSINAASGSENRRRVDVDVLMYDDEAKVKVGGFVTPSSVIHEGDLYVVWVTRNGPPGSNYEYRVHWRDRRCNFGGAHPCGSLEEARQVFDRVRDKEEHQQSLF
jgi:hypothetical protein